MGQAGCQKGMRTEITHITLSAPVLRWALNGGFQPAHFTRSYASTDRLRPAVNNNSKTLAPRPSDPIPIYNERPDERNLFTAPQNRCLVGCRLITDSHVRAVRVGRAVSASATRDISPVAVESRSLGLSLSRLASREQCGQHTHGPSQLVHAVAACRSRIYLYRMSKLYTL